MASLSFCHTFFLSHFLIATLSSCHTFFLPHLQASAAEVIRSAAALMCSLQLGEEGGGQGGVCGQADSEEGGGKSRGCCLVIWQVRERVCVGGLALWQVTSECV